jgi:hypothetical protein
MRHHGLTIDSMLAAEVIPLARPQQHTGVDAAAPRLDREETAARLVKVCEAFLDCAPAHKRPPDLGQRHALDVAIGEPVRHFQRRASMPLGLVRVARPLRFLYREPALLRHRLAVRQQAPRPRELTRRLRRATVNPLLARQVDRQASGVACLALALELRVSSTPPVDRRLALAEPYDHPAPLPPTILLGRETSHICMLSRHSFLDRRGSRDQQNLATHSNSG